MGLPQKTFTQAAEREPIRVTLKQGTSLQMRFLGGIVLLHQQHNMFNQRHLFLRHKTIILMRRTIRHAHMEENMLEESMMNGMTVGGVDLVRAIKGAITIQVIQPHLNQGKGKVPKGVIRHHHQGMGKNL